MIRVEVFDVNTDEVLKVYEKEEGLQEDFHIGCGKSFSDALSNTILPRMLYVASKKYGSDVNFVRAYYNNEEIFMTQTKGYMIAVHGRDKENEDAWRKYFNNVLGLPEDY